MRDLVEVTGVKIGVVVNTNDPETAWNALRFGTTALQSNHQVKIFLLGKGVEVQTLRDEKLDVKGQIDAFWKKGGVVMACGTCLRLRGMGESEICPISTMNDLLKMVGESDKVVTFG